MESVPSGFAPDLDRMCSGFDAGLTSALIPNGIATAKAAKEADLPASRKDDNEKATRWGRKSDRASPQRAKALVGDPVRTKPPSQNRDMGAPGIRQTL
jgi:hypothetical protein